MALTTGGTILELAAGAGGGNLSPLLHLNQAATVVVNDLESRVLSRWQRHLYNAALGQNVIMAAFDACEMPIADGELAAISAVGGLGSLLGEGSKALAECARVLRPGGWLLVSEMVLTSQSLRDLPPELLQNWSRLNWLFGQGENSLRQAGFTVERHQVAGGRTLNLEQDGLAAEAAQFGLTLQVEDHFLNARLT